jgi:hypothetical protein
MDKEIDKGFAAFIATLQGPLGQIPFERAVVRHLPLFLGVPTQNSECRRNSRISLAFGVLSRDRC